MRRYLLQRCLLSIFMANVLFPFLFPFYLTSFLSTASDGTNLSEADLLPYREKPPPRAPLYQSGGGFLRVATTLLILAAIAAAFFYLT